MAGSTASAVNIRQNGVGIGTTIPGAPLAIYNTGGHTSTYTAYFQLQNSPSGSAGSTAAMYMKSDYLGFDVSDNVSNTGANKKNVIFGEYGGNVGIGTVAPGYPLDVVGIARFYSAGSGTAGSSLIISGTNGNYVYLDTATGVGMGLYTGGVQRLDVRSTGVTIASLAGSGNRAVYSDANGLLTNTASDRTLKTNVNSLTYGLEVVSELVPVSFNWIDTERFGTQKEIGFLAQDVQNHIPEVIGTNSDGTLSLDYSKLTSVLVKSIQELSAKNTDLESLLETAQNDIDLLETRLAVLESIVRASIPAAVVDPSVSRSAALLAQAN